MHSFVHRFLGYVSSLPGRRDPKSAGDIFYTPEELIVERERAMTPSEILSHKKKAESLTLFLKRVDTHFEKIRTEQPECPFEEAFDRAVHSAKQEDK